MRKIVSVIGDAKIDQNNLKYKIAFDLGKRLIDEGFRIQTGGLGGIMEAVLKGAKASLNYHEGDTIAILPSFDVNDANEYADIVFPTGLDIFRNVLISNSSAVIAIGGGAGTLSEIAIAWQLFKLIIAFDNVDGWSAKLANTKVDDRQRYENIEDDKIYKASSINECLFILKNKLAQYNKSHTSIKRRS